MTEKELTDIEAALRAEHHSEVRWTHRECVRLIAHSREQSARIGTLELAIRRMLRHQPWPPDDRSERDFNEAARLIPEET